MCIEKHWGINQLEALLSEQNLLELGWRPVLEVDGTHCKTWKKVGIQMERCGMASVSSGERATEPLLITNQALLKINYEFGTKLTTTKIGLAWLLHMKKEILIPKTQIYGPMKSYDKEFTEFSTAVSINLDNLVNVQCPVSLTVTKSDRIMSFGSWFTSGHVENGGDDSITYVPLGKFILIAKRGNPSRRLEALLTSVKALVNLLTKPPPKQWRDSVKFFITQPRSLMIQSALCAQTVLTMGERPALVVGFEGYMQHDVRMRPQVLKYYATGLQRERQILLLKKVSDQTVLGKLQEWKMKKIATFEQ